MYSRGLEIECGITNLQGDPMECSSYRGIYKVAGACRESG